MTASLINCPFYNVPLFDQIYKYWYAKETMVMAQISLISKYDSIEFLKIRIKFALMIKKAVNLAIAIYFVHIKENKAC